MVAISSSIPLTVRLAVVPEPVVLTFTVRAVRKFSEAERGFESFSLFV